VSPDELSLAISYLDGVFPIRYETTAAVAAALAGQIVYGLPPDYFDTYRSRIRAVTAASVLTAAQRHLDTRQMQVVVVGNSDQIRGQVEALKLGPVLDLDPAVLSEAR
jgi:zinc protease